ncbi:DUF418 domain-containing protein [Roseivirga pacifica]|uniref:DUF418 domain-containing protein n=1 Tax=Roseivirga pacifica TaxID=1267423 RepID=UPI003BA967F6
MSLSKVNNRIIGIDVARALAIFGMIIVNFKIVFGGEGAAWAKTLVGLFEGKAAATFVVLAGVGIALITKSAIKTKNTEKLKTTKKQIAKRALLLFLTGISYITIWPADILHFYGIYMLVVLFLLQRSKRFIFLTGSTFIVLFPILMALCDYGTGWKFDTLSYQDFWTIKGFARNLFYNGFHPVIPWAAFMVFGYWLGQQDLRNTSYVKKLFSYSLITFVAAQLLSYLAIKLLSDGSQQMTKEITEILGTSPMPPLPIYMINGVAIAFTTISACILVGKKFENSKSINVLSKTGQLALTFYVAHVVIGMGFIDTITPDKLGQYPVEFSIGYAVVFSILCMLFAAAWLKHKKSGPLEWVFRKLIN